jgi:hypothetical protein
MASLSRSFPRLGTGPLSIDKGFNLEDAAGTGQTGYEFCSGIGAKIKNWGCARCWTLSTPRNSEPRGEGLARAYAENPWGVQEAKLNSEQRALLKRLVLEPDGREPVNRKTGMSQVSPNCLVAVEERLTPAEGGKRGIDATPDVVRSRSERDTRKRTKWPTQ